MKNFWIIGLAVLACAAMNAGEARACAEESAPGVKVAINDEAAAIVWDARTRTEHFIRRATFDASASPHTARDIGFLVPTPTTPQIGAVSPTIFDILDAATQPRVQANTLTGFKTEWLLGKLAGQPGSDDEQVAKASNSTAASVQVTKTVRVGDFDATVLAARDTKALARWLRAHGFNADESLQAWLTPYVRHGWKITAFKVANQGAGAQFDLSPVRLSFHADAPFYPYREPASARAKGNFAASRALKVYFVGAERVAGMIGAKTQWPGQTAWTAALPAASAAALKNSGIPSSTLANARMTVFRDESSPRPGTDEVFFTRAKDQQKIVPALLARTVDKRATIPMELLIAGFIGFCIACLKRANALAERRLQKRAAEHFARGTLL